jgi:hypothetical protein
MLAEVQASLEHCAREPAVPVDRRESTHGRVVLGQVGRR